jgi:hypothetical protein
VWVVSKNHHKLLQELCLIKRALRSPFPTQQLTRWGVSEFLTLGGKARCKLCQSVSVKTKQRHSWPTAREIKLCANHFTSGRGPLTEERKASSLLASASQNLLVCIWIFFEYVQPEECCMALNYIELWRTGRDSNPFCN